jgi:8-oxo-dGTP diphosphatase
MVHRRRRGTAIVDSSNGILVVSENGTLFSLPGGGASHRESREEAAKRELREETGLVAETCTFLFRFTGRVHKDYKGGYYRDYHKIFLVTTNGTAAPRREIRKIEYFDGSNVKVSPTSRKIIEKYNQLKTSKLKLFPLRCSYCGAILDVTNPFGLIKCDYCGTTYHERTPK